MRRRALVLRLSSVLAGAAVVLTGCGLRHAVPGPKPTPSQSAAGGAAVVLDPAAVKQALSGVGSKPGQDLAPARLGPGLVPPTNKWFSGLVFGAQPNPVFPLPLSFGLDGGGFGFGVPDVKTTTKTIAGGYRPAVKAVVQGATDWQVTGYDELSVTLAPRGASGQLTITQGSPFVSYAAPDGATLTTNRPFTKQGEAWISRDPTGDVALVLDQGTVSGTTITLGKGGRVTWIAVPADGSVARLTGLAVAPAATSAAYSVAGDTVTTRLHYADQDTAFAVLPHQQAGQLDARCDLGTYPSVMGTMKLCSGKELAFTTPAYAAQGTLDVSALSDADKADLRKQLAVDIGLAKPYPADTYFGGKAMYRDAQLYAIAKQLGAPEAAQIKTKLLTTMDRWMDPKGCTARSEFCFGYDATNKGIVGQTPSFDSDKYNDHHFHYGYFLYAAGVLAADDPSLVAKYRPVATLLAADLASSTPSAEFPVRRTFDAWNGHSWASGTSPFGDGNDEESSSEAVNAWAGLRLWAQAAKNDALATEATWMQSLEATTARDYWIAFDRTQPVYRGYGHTITPMIFGGKRDYATWFSPDPAAMLGIQVLPMSPSHAAYLRTDAARIKDNVAEATPGGFAVQYGDFLIMYAALQGEAQRKDAVQKARDFPVGQLDDGLTKTYLLAFCLTAKA